MNDFVTLNNSMKRNCTLLQSIKDETLERLGVELYIKREDLNHPIIQGNKYWKLRYNLRKAQQLGQEKVVTFGGAFSNHIYATAAAGHTLGLKTIGIIRGEKREPLNHTLKAARSYGMELHFISREAYREKNQPDFLINLEKQFENCYIIPEGGTNRLAINGCKEWAKEIQEQGDFDKICLPVGTGGTITGLIAGFDGNREILGFSSLKGDFLYKEVENLLLDYNQKKYANWDINTSYHFGGYAKHKKELIEFINEFKATHNIQLDPIYTGKMMFGIYQMIKNGDFPKGTRILAIHTGGLQGIAGFNKRYGNLIKI